MSVAAFAKDTRRKDAHKHTAVSNASGIPGALNYPIDNDLSSVIINDAFMSEELAGAIIDGSIVETMDGAATLEFVVNDTERKLVHDKILKDWVKIDPPIVIHPVRGQHKVRAQAASWNEVYCTMDGRDFALSMVHKSGSQFTLTFENRAIHELRKYNKPKVWYRDAFTRAMVIKAMCDEVVGYHIPFFAPELHKKQPIATAKRQPTPSQTKVLKGHGFAPRAPVTVKHVGASPQQKDYIGRVITTGEHLNASYKVLVSSIMTITQESDVSILHDPATGIGLFSQIPADGWPATGSNIEKDATAYFDQAIKLDRTNPNWSPGQIAQGVQRSAFPTAYDQWKSEAENTIKLWGTSAHGGSISFTEFNRYAFKRGVDGKREDSWTCGLRLATEVNWRLFALDNTIYYVNDNDLLAAMPLDTISEKDDGIDTIDYEIDTGKRISECTVAAHFGRWKTPAGQVVMVQDQGPADGRWIVHEVHRPLFSNVGEITLRLPTPALLEPAPTTKTVTIKGSAVTDPKSGSKGVDAAYAEANRISAKNYPYVWGGGHATAGVADSGSGGGQIGYDCSGYVSACLHAAGWLQTPQVSGSLASWGQPGEGKLLTVWSNNGHTFIEFKFPSSSRVKHKHSRADTVPDPGTPNGPHIRDGWPPPEGTSGFTPRHWAGA